MREDGLHQKGSEKYISDGWDKRYTIPLEKYKIIFEVFKWLEFCGNLSDPIYHPEFVDTLKYLKGKDAQKLIFVQTVAVNQKDGGKKYLNLVKEKTGGGHLRSMVYQKILIYIERNKMENKYGK